MNNLNQVEKRVSSLEGAMGKVAKLTNSLHEGQLEILDVIHTIGGAIADEVKEQVAQEVASESAKIGQELNTKVNTTIIDVEDLKGKYNEIPVNRMGYETLQKIRKTVTSRILKGDKSPQYILISSKIYSNISNTISKNFHVSSYKDVPIAKLEEVKQIINNYRPHPYWISKLWEELLGQYESGELSPARTNAMKKILDSKQTLMSIID